MSNELPALKVGQVWQCRDQQYTVKLFEAFLPNFRGRVYEGGALIGGYNVEWNYCVEYLIEGTDRVVRYQVFSVDEPHDHDLVALLYDPDDADT